MKCQIRFSGKKNMKTIINLWSAEFAQRVVKVNSAGYLLILNGRVEGLMRLRACISLSGL